MIDLDGWRLILVGGWLVAFAVLTRPLRQYLGRHGRPAGLSLLLLAPGVSLVALYLMRLRK